MSLFNNLFKKPDVPIAVVQYKRKHYGVGEEEQFHWALVAFTGFPSNKDSGRAWQAVNPIVVTNGVPQEQWQLNIADVELDKTYKCLGGVLIGDIKAKDLEALEEMLRKRTKTEGDAMILTPKSADWRCKHWVMETVHEVLIPNGWADSKITDRDALYPAMKVASKASHESKIKQGKSVFVDLGGRRAWS